MLLADVDKEATLPKKDEERARIAKSGSVRSVARKLEFLMLRGAE